MSVKTFIESGLTTGTGTVRIAGRAEESITDGPGIRFVLFTQGCPRACPGCHNPETQSLEGGTDVSIGSILRQIESNPLLSGVTFSGGEPFLQAKPLAELARACRRLGLHVMVYSGYLFEELAASENPDWIALLRVTDTLVDGPYIQSKRSLALRFRGSSNQRILDVRRSLAAGRGIEE